MGQLLGGGAAATESSGANSVMNSAFGPIINAFTSQLGQWQRGGGPEQNTSINQQYNAQNQNREAPGQTQQQLTGQNQAAHNLLQGGNLTDVGGLNTAAQGLLNNNGAGQSSVMQAIAGLLGPGGAGLGGANQAMNNLLNFSQTQQPEVQTAANTEAQAGQSNLKTLLSQLGGTPNVGALAGSMNQNLGQQNAQTSQALGSQLVGQNLSAQEGAGQLGSGLQQLLQSALSSAGGLGAQQQGLNQSALAGAGNLYGAGNQQYLSGQEGASSAFGQAQNTAQGAQQNSFQNFMNALTGGQNLLTSMMGGAGQAGTQYGGQQEYYSGLGASQQGNNLSMLSGGISGLAGMPGLSSLFGGGTSGGTGTLGTNSAGSGLDSLGNNNFGFGFGNYGSMGGPSAPLPTLVPGG